jgi:hypothetical protein
MPDIKFACQGCKASLKVGDTLAGKKIKCPKCAAVVAVPGGAAPPAAAPARPAAPPAARPAAPAVPAKPPAIKAPARVAPAPKPPPPPEPDPIDDLMEMAPDQEPAPMDEADDVPPPRRTAPAPRKGGLDTLTLIAWLLIFGYVAFVALVYLGVVWPKP